MIDLHNHILPGVDDGATSLEESLDIAGQFLSEGVRTVVATPHLDPLRGNGVAPSVVGEKVETLTIALREAGIPLEVLPGQEIFLVPEVPDLLSAGRARTLADSGYVLVEVDFNQRPLYLEDTLFRLQSDGVQPILAHPERYLYLQRSPELVDNLLSRGIALQLTAPAILGEYGPAVRRYATHLLRYGAYSLLSSDRHHPGAQRSLAAARQRIAQVAGDEVAGILCDRNPKRVLAGAQIEPAVPPPASGPSLRRILGRLFAKEE